MEQLSILPNILASVGFTSDHPQGAKARFLSLPATAVLGSSLLLWQQEWFADANTDASKSQVPTSAARSHFQPVLSLPSRTSATTFQKLLVAQPSIVSKGRLHSSASQGHLWVCPGPPQHRMGLYHPLVAYKGRQA